MDNIEKFQKLKRINEIKTILHRAEIDDLFSVGKQSLALFAKVQQLSFFGKLGFKLLKKFFKN